MRAMLVVNPRSDALFVADVHEQADGLSDTDAGALEHRLRDRHPRATVHVRELSSEPSTVWYVYRDGRWTPPTE